jgi:7-cyano-7-deazaguanine synthase
MGVSASDSDFPDCNKDFLQNEMAPFYSFAVTGNRDTFRCVLPLIDLTKAQVVIEAQELLGDRFEQIIELTHTCYFPSRGGCGEKKCRACLFREQAFKEVGIKDPLSKFRKSPTRQEVSALTPSPQQPSPQQLSPQQLSIPELSTQEG